MNEKIHPDKGCIKFNHEKRNHTGHIYILLSILKTWDLVLCIHNWSGTFWTLKAVRSTCVEFSLRQIGFGEDWRENVLFCTVGQNPLPQILLWMRSSRAVRASHCQRTQSQQSWVRSQHPPTRYYLRGGRWSSIEWSTWKKISINPPVKKDSWRSLMKMTQTSRHGIW